MAINFFLRIIPIDAQQDWEKLYAYNNWKFGMPECPDVKLLPFRTPEINNASGSAIAELKLKEVVFSSGGEKSYTGVEEPLDVSLLNNNKIEGNTRTYFWYGANVDQTEFGEGCYEFYIKLNGVGTEWISEPFKYTSPVSTISQAGDFDAGDFSSEDFNVHTGGGTGVQYDGYTITSYNLPQIYPDGFYDKAYFNSRDHQVVRRGSIDLGRVMTGKKYKKIGESSSEDHVAQGLLYKKYSLSITAKENNEFQRLLYANDVTIKDWRNQITHNAKLMPGSFKESPLADTELREIKIEFYDNNPRNYNDNIQPVINYLRSDEVANLEESARYAIEFSSSQEIDADWLAEGNTYTIYTILQPEQISTQVVEQGGKTGELLDIISRQTKQTGKLYRCYCNDTDKEFVVRYMEMCNVVQDSLGSTIFPKAIDTVRPKFRQIQQGVDLWEIDIFIPTNNIDFTPDA